MRSAVIWSCGPRQKANSSAWCAILGLLMPCSIWTCGSTSLRFAQMFRFFLILQPSIQTCQIGQCPVTVNSHVRNSYPFDWTRSSLDGLLHCMDNRFEAWDMTSQTTFIAELPLHFSSLITHFLISQKLGKSEFLSEGVRTHFAGLPHLFHLQYGGWTRGLRWHALGRLFLASQPGSPKDTSWDDQDQEGKGCVWLLRLFTPLPAFVLNTFYGCASTVSWALATWCRRFHASTRVVNSTREIGSSIGSWLG